MQPHNDTALMKASRNGHASTAELLLTRGADPNVQNIVSILNLFSIEVEYRLLSFTC